MQHFDAMDDLAQKMQQVQSALSLATAFEKYSEAADLKKELDQLNANDVVEQILEVTSFVRLHPCLLYSGHRVASVTCAHSLHGYCIC